MKAGSTSAPTATSSSPINDNLVFEVLRVDAVHEGPGHRAGRQHHPAERRGPPRGIPTPSCSGGGRGADAPPPPPGPTQAELDAYFAQMAPKVKGADRARRRAVRARLRRNREREAPRTMRRSKAQYNPDPNAPPAAGRGGNRGGGGGAGRGAAAPGRSDAPHDAAGQHAARRLPDEERRGGPRRRRGASASAIVRQQSGNGYDSSKNLPGRAAAQRGLRPHRAHPRRRHAGDARLQHRQPRLPEGKTSYNAIAEIVGTDKADEVVMLGGHLDSWHSATGATDNAIGCAIMMEAVRILQAVGAKPRRTIRVALWGGEEEGLLGSLAYVAAALRHGRDAEEPEFAKLDALLEHRQRHRPRARRRRLRTARGARRSSRSSSSRSKTSASTARRRRQLAHDRRHRQHVVQPRRPARHRRRPGLASNTARYTHHTNLDTYERILPEDVKKDAIITASVVYHIAMRDEMMPRFAKEQMPPLPAGRGGGGGQR